MHIVGIGRIFISAKVADSYVLCVVGVGMTARRNESVGRIVGAEFITFSPIYITNVYLPTKQSGKEITRDYTICNWTPNSLEIFFISRNGRISTYSEQFGKMLLFRDSLLNSGYL